MRTWLYGLLTLAVASGASASSVRKDFANIWSAREADYISSDQTAEKSEIDLTRQLVQTYNANGPTLVQDFQNAMGATRNHGQSTARLKLLKEFEAFMATKPTPAGAQAWMQGKIAQIKEAVPGTQAEEERLAKVKIGVDEPADQWIREKARSAQISGMMSGLVSELTLIDDNLRAYYQGVGAEQQEARETRRRILGGLAAGLAAAAATPPPPPRPASSFNMTCSKLGTWTNCNGSVH